MRQNRRWQLNDLQRFLVALMVCAAFFLSAMAWGSGSLAMLLIAAVLVLIVGLSVFLLGLRYRSRPSGPGTAYVVTAPPPPIGKIVARLEMTVLLDMPGAPAGKVKLRDPSAPTSKWPRTGDVLPADIDPRTRHVHIRWDRTDPAQTRATTPPMAPHGREPQPAPSSARALGPAPSREPEYEYSPTPGSAPEDIVTPAILDPDAVDPRLLARQDEYGDPGEPVTKLFLDDDLSLGVPEDLGGERTLDYDEMERKLGLIDDPDAELADPDPTTTDTGEFGLLDDDPALAVPPGVPVEPAPAVAAPPPAIPHPRDAEPPLPAGGESGQAMGGMLIVSNLARSVAFYRDLLGFALADQSEGTAVLDFGPARVLLSQVADMSPVDRRVVHLHVQVADVDSLYAALKAKGVSFVHRPRVMSRGDRLEVWGATLRDPDGHAVALTQWRDRQDAPR